LQTIPEEAKEEKPIEKKPLVEKCLLSVKALDYLDDLFEQDDIARKENQADMSIPSFAEPEAQKPLTKQFEEDSEK